MSIRIANRSRLKFTDLISKDGYTFWDATPQVDIPEQDDDIQYTVRDLDRIDSLAVKFYGDPVLWWVIAQANDWELVPSEIATGDVIRIPSPRYVLGSLFKATNSKAR